MEKEANSPKSSFEKSVCCTSGKSICGKIPIYGLMVAFNTILEMIGGLLILNNIPGEKGFIAGLILHGISLIIEFCLSIYPVRYLIGMYDANPNILNKNIYLAKSYILWALYIFSIIIASSICKGVEDVLAANRSFVTILIFFGSFLIISYWSMIISPTCTPVNKDKHQLFQNREKSFNASLNLAIVFIVSYIVTNIGFGIYYTDIILHYTLILTGIVSMSVSIILQCIFKYQNGDLDRAAFGVWIFAVIVYVISSTILFFLALFKFQIDPLYQKFSYERNVYFIVQASFTFLFGALFIGELIRRLINYCICKTALPENLVPESDVLDCQKENLERDVVLEKNLYQSQNLPVK